MPTNKDINKANLTAKMLQAGFVWLDCHYILDYSLLAGGKPSPGKGSLPVHLPSGTPPRPYGEVCWRGPSGVDIC